MSFPELGGDTQAIFDFRSVVFDISDDGEEVISEKSYGFHGQWLGVGLVKSHWGFDSADPSLKGTANMIKPESAKNPYAPKDPRD